MIDRLAIVDRTGALLETLLSAANSLDPPPELVQIAEAADLTGDALLTDVLLLGPKELTPAGLKRLAAWRSRHQDCLVLASLEGRALTKLELRASGIDVVFTKTPSVLDLLKALEGGRPPIGTPAPAPAPRPTTEAPLSRKSRNERVTTATPEAPATAEDEIPEAPSVAAPAEPAAAQPDATRGTTHALLLTVASPTGGCGKTFFSTNLTAHLASAGRRVLLVDLDLQFGEVAAALQVKHAHSIYDGFYDAAGRPLPEDALETHLDELVHHHVLGCDLLLAPRDPALADYLTAANIEHLLQVAAQRYDVVIIDTPPVLNEVTLTVLDRSDVIGIMTTLDVPSLRNLTSLLDILEQLQVDPDRIRLLLNKVETDIGLDVKQAQDAFQNRFVGEIPANKAASRSINTGTVVLRSEPRSNLARALVRSIEALVPTDVLPRNVDAKAHSKNRFGRSSSARSRRSAGGTP